MTATRLPEPAARLPSGRPVDLRADDGHPLAATLYEPLHGNGVAVVISPAYAVPRRYYAAYARYLAGLGFTVLSLDWRGVGESRQPGARQWAYRLQHWGERDLPAAIDWLADQCPGQTLVAVGHSAGGQMIGLARNNHRLAAALTVSSQIGYWRLFDYPYNLLALAWFRVVVPLRTLLNTAIPSLRRGGFDVPAGVAWQWARWGRDPEYFIDDSGRSLRPAFAGFRGWLRLYAVSDDLGWAPRRAVEALAARFVNARSEVRNCAPSDWGVPRIGHFGFFRPAMPRAAWQETAQWLLAAARAPESQIHEEIRS